MEVAKYIGLFLLKNKACYIHGLGNLELKKKPATFNGDALQAGSYEVVLTSAGSIDDNLANFIATNELISISKASNALRDYSTQAKADLAQGKDVVIPAIGKFTEVDGKMKFLTDPHLQYTPPPIQAIRTSRRAEEEMMMQQQPQQYNPPHREYIPQAQQAQQQSYPGGMGRQLNWNRIFLVIFLILVAVVGGIYAIRFVKNRSLSYKVQTMAPPTDTATAPKKDSTVTKIDSVANADSSVGTIQKTPDGMLHFKVIIDNFTTRKKADKRAKTMISYGHQAEVIVEDSNSYDVVMPVNAMPADTAHIMDSMRRNYNPAGVYIY
ncbi:MAG: hypothetical protein JSS82_18535 [Bacteroidetes bacterium]|nr:hypothetical protein [Bacteroidota bacterium]